VKTILKTLFNPSTMKKTFGPTMSVRSAQFREPQSSRQDLICALFKDVWRHWHSKEFEDIPSISKNRDEQSNEFNHSEAGPHGSHPCDETSRVGSKCGDVKVRATASSQPIHLFSHQHSRRQPTPAVTGQIEQHQCQFCPTCSAAW